MRILPPRGEPPTESPGADEPLPELNCFFLNGKRHDRDRIEIQIGFDGTVPQAQSQRHFFYDFACLFFVPKTMGLLEVEESQQLRQEFQSYIRLHTHAANPKNSLSLHRVKERLHHLKTELRTDTLRIFAIEFEAYLKAQVKKTKGRSSEAGTALEDIESTRWILQDFRSILRARSLEEHDADDYTRGGVDHDLLLLNEYVSHLYVQYLAEVQQTCRVTKGLEEVAAKVEKDLREEAEARQRYKLYVAKSDDGLEVDEELYPRRMSLLKKYFQKSVFVQVRGETLQNRMLVPVYGISAALCAAWAIMIQLYQARNVAERVGINSIALISIGVIAYVAKDLMKDFFRKFFYQQSTHFFRDYKKNLFIERHGKEVPLGEIKEYLRAFDSGHLPKAVRAARYAGRGGEMEEFLHEDVLYFRKRVRLNLSELEARHDFPWGLREIFRFRFDRLLTSVEDPFKSLHLLTDDGAAVSRQGHRLYHVYIAAWIYTRELSPKGSAIPPAFKAFRITLDKSGVLECKEVNWDEQIQGIPDMD